ncbi:MAG: TonB-dependent receptor [Flavobacteriaceae bacterium]|nr:TonB-dependent receptor [Flavobacteriaceae bacterium]
MNKIFLVGLMLVTTFVFSQEMGTIQGVVLDKETNNEPLPFANVYIKDSQTGTSTDLDGIYLFKAQPGTYTLVFTFVGYEKIEVPDIIVKAGQVTTLENVILGATEGVSLKEVIVKASTQKESVAALLTEQKKAVEIKTAIGAEELSIKGISDAASAITKMSGVSKQEGSSNVYVRGLGDRYQNTTFNGLSLPSNDVNKKNIDLNLFSTDIIENVSIAKAYSTKFYADFSAGNVDIKSKDYNGPGFIELAAGTGFNTNALNKDFVRSEGTGYFGYYGRYAHNPFAIILSHGFDPESAGTPMNISYGGSAGKSFNFNNGSRLSLFLTGSFENSYEYRSGSATDYTLTEKKAFDAAEEYEYSTNTTIMGTASYKVDDRNSFKYTSLFINNSSDVVGYFGTDGQGRNRDAQIDTEKGFYQMNVQFDQTQMTVNQLEGKHKAGKFDIDWGLGYNLVYAKQPDRKRISLEDYQYALDNDPNTNPVFYSNVVFDNQRYFQNITDEELNSILNIAYNVSDNFKLNLGYDGKWKHRKFDNIRYGYDILEGDFPVTDVNNFNAIFTIDNMRVNPNGEGLYQIKVINPIPLISNTNRPGLPENAYNGKLDIYAGYLNAEIKAGEKWLFVPGVRVESVEQNINYDVINLGNKGKDTITANQSFYLPSLNIKYALNEDMNLRLSASQTVSLPEFKEVAPFVYESISTRIGGNPDLLGSRDPNAVNVGDKSYSTIFNADLKYEWFFGNSELLSLAAFAKEIKDPINLVVGADATGTQRYFRTGKKATIYGVELELRKNFLTNDNESPKLSVGFNGTYMKTEQDLFDNITGTYNLSFNRSKDKLQGASPWLLNADINYSPVIDKYKPTVSLVYSFFSDRIDALGSGQLGNVIEKSVSTLDFIWLNRISDKFEVNLSIRNLLNPTIKYVRQTTLGDVVVTSANGKGISGYERGMNFGLQLKYKF